VSSWVRHQLIRLKPAVDARDATMMELITRPGLSQAISVADEMGVDDRPMADGPLTRRVSAKVGEIRTALAAGCCGISG